MAHVDEWVRCEPHDPNRCQASGQQGQCRYKATAGSTYCIRHNSLGKKTAAKNAANMYRLAEYQSRVEEFTTHDELKNLRAEIGILRLLLENIVVLCKGNPMELNAYSGKVADLAVKLNVLMKTCHHIEKDMGMLLDRDKIMIIAQQIVIYVSDVVPDPDKLDVLSQKIVTMILAVSSGEFQDTKIIPPELRSVNQLTDSQLIDSQLTDIPEPDDIIYGDD